MTKDSFNFIQPVKVKSPNWLRNGVVISSSNKGTIAIVTHKGVKHIKKVYVPDLGKNLITIP